MPPSPRRGDDEARGDAVLNAMWTGDGRTLEELILKRTP
jgi:hypothetical protein